jgi:hypothetical protein
VCTAAEIAMAIRLIVADHNARSPSNNAATERCVFTTAATPKPLPEKEISTERTNETGRCQGEGRSDLRSQESKAAHTEICGQGSEAQEALRFERKAREGADACSEDEGREIVSRRGSTNRALWLVRQIEPGEVPSEILFPTVGGRTISPSTPASTSAAASPIKAALNEWVV